MNNNFELILKNNQEFISTLNNIVKDLKNNEFSFWSDTKNVLNPTSFYEDLKSKLKSKKYKNFFNDVICLPGPEANGILHLVDKNGLNWVFELKDNTVEILEINEVFLESNLVIRYEKNMSMIAKIICKNKNDIKDLFDLKEKELTINEAEIIYLTTDIDLKPLIDHSANKVIFPNVNGVSFKEAYEKKGMLKKIFNI